MGSFNEKKAAKQKDFNDFYQAVSNVCDYDYNEFCQHYDWALKYDMGNNFNDRNKENSKLLYLWYKSITSDIFNWHDVGNPFYEVYEMKEYLPQAYAMYISFSNKYADIIKNLVSNGKIKNPKTIVDLGCGCGLTTKKLAQTFPNAIVYGTQLDNTFQMNVAKEINKDMPNVILKGDIKDCPENVDLILASEYFEHFIEPLIHLDEVITAVSPETCIIANAFGNFGLGHFYFYKDGDKMHSGKNMSMRFASKLRKMGYKNCKMGLWNDRPNIYIQENSRFVF